MMSQISLTPYYLINKQALDKAVEELNQAISRHWSNTVVGYSFKTNSLPWLVQYMKGKGLFAEVVSDDEYNLAVYLGYKDEEIIYNGLAKSKETLLSVIKKKGFANIDSNYEIDWLLDLPKSERYKVGIRVNFDLEKECPGETSYGEEGSRFGFCVDNGDLYKAIERINGLGNVEVVGFHMHTSTRTRSLNVFKTLAIKACELAEHFKLSLSYVDIGGGFFGGLEDKPNFNNYMETISSVLKKYYSPDELTLIVEPGVSIIGPYISYVTSVVDIKNTTKNKFVITDGSRIHIDTRMTKTEYSKDLLYCSDDNREEIPEQIVCGFTCMEADRIVTLENTRELRIGDKIVFHKVGAYTLSLAPLFIKYFPDVYVEDESQMELVRKRWSFEEYSRNSIIK